SRIRYAPTWPRSGIRSSVTRSTGAGRWTWPRVATRCTPRRSSCPRLTSAWPRRSPTICAPCSADDRRGSFACDRLGGGLAALAAPAARLLGRRAGGAEVVHVVRVLDQSFVEVVAHLLAG